MKPSAPLLLTLGIAACLPMSPALAAPSVDGTAIVVPDDGWYQVQDAATYASLCEGVRRCDVGPGTYLVVDHTTGTRYERVEVPASATGAPSVDGDTISWADDGWYQVQDAVTYESLCQGGRSCEVPSGTYRVINLTLGTRYEGIVVEAGSRPGPDPDPDPGPGPVGGDAFPGRIAPDLLVGYDPDTSTGLPPGTTSAGDVNGDGREDAVVILRTDAQASPVSAGILFADASGGFPGLPADPGDPDAPVTVERAGFVIGGVSPDITSVGDVNGDGFDDLSFSSDGFFELSRGYVLAGEADPRSLFAGRAADVDAGRALVEVGVSAGFTSAGDVNGDGIGDLFVTSPSDAFSGLLYGAVDLDATLADREALRALTLVGDCAGLYCSSRPVGDVDGDGFDDVYVSRFGGGDCGFGSDTGILYGAAAGIARRGEVSDFPETERTLIAYEGAGQCLPSSSARVTGVGDVDGDGRSDLVIVSRFGAGPSVLVFGRAERVPVLWVHAFDGQRGATIDVDTVPTIDDVDGDGLADLVFEDERIFAGRARDVASIDGPVVRRSPDAFEVRAGSPAPAGTDDWLVELDGGFAGTLDGAGESVEVTDTTGGDEARIVLRARDESGTALATTSRTVPAYDGPVLEAELVAPRLVRLFVDDLSPPLRSYGRSLVWRDGVPVGRSPNGGDNWFDTGLVLGRTYTYFVTPDYLPPGSLEPSSLADAPLVQRRSNTVTVTLPLF